MADTQTIDFHFIKSAEYRSYHADGAVGSITPRGGVYISFYLERAPIPQKVTFELKETGQLGDELRVEGKEGVIRELEFGVAMDANTAENLKNWLAEVIANIKGTPQGGGKR